MTLSLKQVELTNWSKSTHSACLVYPVRDLAGILEVFELARAGGYSVIPHGAGHSYTDAVLNTGGVVLDLTPMRRILSWNPQQGVMCVEPGVTLQDMIQVAWKDGWWPVVTPSTPSVTIGGCTAMNVNGRNAFKCGPFGANILSLDIVLPSGELRTLSPAQEHNLFHAFVGSLGLLGVTTSITLQLQPLASGQVAVRRHSAAALEQIFAIFAQEEERSDFMEAWLDGFAMHDQLGRGHVTCATFSSSGQLTTTPFLSSIHPTSLEEFVFNMGATLVRPVLLPGVKMANQLNFWWGNRLKEQRDHLRNIIPYTFWPEPAFAAYHAIFTPGVETFQAFVPQENAPYVFEQLLHYSQQHGCSPLWCIIKRHRRDPFLLSYQVDGFSLELNYARSAHSTQQLLPVLQHMIAIVIDAGGRFYLAKDHYQTAAQYRQSIGDQTVETFLQFKQQFDPHLQLQSDLFRRLFQPAVR